MDASCRWCLEGAVIFQIPSPGRYGRLSRRVGSQGPRQIAHAKQYKLPRISQNRPDNLLPPVAEVGQSHGEIFPARAVPPSFSQLHRSSIAEGARDVNSSRREKRAFL